MDNTDRRLCFVGIRPTGDFAGLTAYTNRKRKVVWFPKSPPKTPPSIRQIHQRQLFAAAAQAWMSLAPESRLKWHQAAAAAHLYLTGYTLYIKHTLTPVPEAIKTIERLSGIELITK